MDEPRLLNVIQDNLLLCYDLTKVDEKIRDVDFLYISRFLSSLNCDELTMLWISSISPDFISDLDMVNFLCEWIIPYLEGLEWYESCSSVMRTWKDTKLYLSNFPE
jgi:hypothetical protein